MTAAIDPFPGWAERRLKTQGGEIAVRTAGVGPPLLLPHGYPQPHACWHKIAAELAAHRTLVIADRGGYRGSSVPADTPEHKSYAKQTLALDCLAVMRALFHARFMLGGHDRGGHVAYRLALDHPETIMALLPIDIVPTAEVWRRVGPESAVASEHWGFLAQPWPVPERLIAAAPLFYLEHTLTSLTKSGDLSPFSTAPLAHSRALLQHPSRLYAPCEGAAPFEVWGARCTDLSGAEIDSGHFLAEPGRHTRRRAAVPCRTGSRAQEGDARGATQGVRR